MRQPIRRLGIRQALRPKSVPINFHRRRRPRKKTRQQRLAEHLLAQRRLFASFVD